MINTLSPYFSTPTLVKWHLKPEWQGQTALLIDPYQGLSQEIAELGWTISVLLTQKEGLSWDGQRDIYFNTEDLNQSFDLILIPNAIAYVSRARDFVLELKKQLSSKGRLWVFFPNALYYPRLIAKSTRDLRPWPSEWPQGRTWTPERLDQEFRELRQEGQWQPIMDPQAFENGFEQWRFVDGVDVRVQLPADRPSKELYFCKGWTWEWQSPQQQSSSFEDRINKVQELLQKGQLELIPALLDTLTKIQPQDERIQNFRGIYAFYGADYTKAYSHFLQSLELNPNQQECWENAADAANKIGRMDDLNWLWSRKSDQLPFDRCW